MTDAPHVVIVGAGFAGLSAVGGLRKAGARVTMIDENLYNTFQPLLYQVATGGLNAGDVSYPVGGFAARRRSRYTRGALATIDEQARRITLTDGREFGYDYLIIATGVAANYFGVQGAAENTFGLYTRVDAIVLRDHFMNGYERLSADPGGAPGVRRSPWSAAAPPASSCAGTLGELRGRAAQPRSPTSTRPGCTSGWSRWRPRC